MTSPTTTSTSPLPLRPLTLHTITHPSVHSIISVTTYSAILSSPDQQRDKLTGGKSGVGEASGSGWTIIKIFLFVGLVVGAFYGYKQYTLKQGRSGAGFGSGSFGSVGRSMQGFGGALYDSKRF